VFLFHWYTTALFLIIVGRHNAVGIATRYGVEGPGIEYRWGVTFYTPVQTGPGADTASCKIGTGCFSPGVKWPRRGVNHPPHLAQSLKKE
jgi:hypothetical protein